MRRTAGAISALIFAIAIYFALFWGFDALRILTSPAYGLEDVWRSQVVFGIGRYAGFGPEALIRLAAALGAVKLVIAGACAIHVFERMRGLLTQAKPGNDILEMALIVAVGVSIAALVPAILSQNADLAREQMVQLVLAGVTAVFCMLERGWQKGRPAASETATVAVQPIVLR